MLLCSKSVIYMTTLKTHGDNLHTTFLDNTPLSVTNWAVLGCKEQVAAYTLQHYMPAAAMIQPASVEPLPLMPVSCPCLSLQSRACWVSTPTDLKQAVLHRKDEREISSRTPV
jgi:hypothetical protein